MATRQRWQVAALKEARAAPEFAAFVGLAGVLLTRAPRGDAHPVVVLPGLGAGDGSTAPLRWFLERLGYRTHGWGLGTNTGRSRQVPAALDERLSALVDEHGQRVSVVGWSLGGVYATALAARASQRVRSVITLGSPIAGRRLPVDVPTTSVYSRSGSCEACHGTTLSDRLYTEVVGTSTGRRRPAIGLPNVITERTRWEARAARAVA